MALADEVTARYPEPRLRQLTNGGTESASSINTTTLGYAATDVQADFKTYCGVAYDNSDARHVAVAVEGVIAKLYQRGEAPGSKANALHDAYIERLTALAKVTGRDRLKPTTKSVLTPTSEQQDSSQTVRPSFDDFGDFDRLIPDPPN